MTEPLDLEAIRKRVEAATKGPWEAFCKTVCTAVLDRFGDEIIHWMGFDGPTAKGAQSTTKKHANAEFIAHAREDIPALIAEVERLRAERDAPRQTVVDQQLDIDRFGALAEAAQKVIDRQDEILQEDYPVKYRAAFGPLAELSHTLTALQESDSDEQV